MFEMLLESGQRTSLAPSWGKGVAVTLHVLIIATLLRSPAAPAAISTDRVVELPRLEPVRTERSTAPTIPVVGDPMAPQPWSLPRVVIPEGIVKALGTPVINGVVDTTQVGGPLLQPDGGVYLPALVQDAPELLSAPVPVYPPLLRAAGVQGEVMVAAVVDTLGRAESGSVRIVLSDNSGFDAAALATVRAAQFRPARIFGRAVRVLVQLPVVFRLN